MWSEFESEVVPMDGAAPMVAVLGPTRVSGGSITSAQRILLAQLAMRPQDGASIETLIDVIWTDEVPNTARASVQNQVARLRRTFGHRIIESEDGRYVLGVDTDAQRFERTIRAATVGAATTEDLRRVLDLWRGEAFDDLSDDGAAMAERSRLDRLRNTGVELLARQLLASGRADEAVVTLSSHTAMGPWHEAAWELLVVALYVTGDRAGSLACFQRFAAVLDDELGAQPSASFRRIRAAVLDEQPRCALLASIGIEPRPDDRQTPLAGRDVNGHLGSSDQPTSPAPGGV